MDFKGSPEAAKVFEGEVGLEILGVGLEVFEVGALVVLEILGRGTVAASSQTSRGINICWTNIIRIGQSANYCFLMLSNVH